MNQTQFAIDPTEFPVNPELEAIMTEQRNLAAKRLVDDLNQKFFESVAAGLVDGQQITFHDKDGSKYIIKNGSVKILDQEGVDFIEHENGKHICPNCRRSVDLQKQTFNQAHVRVLIKAYDLAIKTGQQYIQIQQLHLDSFYYGVMNHLIRFGLAFRNRTIEIDGKTAGVYGIPRKRVSDFLQGNWTVADSYIDNPTLPKSHKDKRKMSERRITINQVPSIAKVREEYGEKLCSYVWTEPDDFINENISE